MQRFELRTHIKFIDTHVCKFKNTPHNGRQALLCGVTGLFHMAEITPPAYYV